MQTIGAAILIVLVVLIGFGFLLDHTLNLNQELAETREQLARIQVELQTLQAQYQAVIQEKDRLIEQVSVLTGEKTNLQARVESLEAERQMLAGQIETLQRKLAFMETANTILTSPGSSSLKRVAVLLVLPMVPLSLGAVYVMTSRKATNSPPKRPGHTTFQAALTREEFHLIAQRRRSQLRHQQ